MGSDYLSTEDHEELKRRFKLVCRKCGSEDVLLCVDPGRNYSEYSRDPPRVSVGCNGCNDNDFHVDL